MTPAALLEQLVYVDTFLPEIEDNQLDDTLTAELSAFADESFIFPDEEKPANNSNGTSSNGNGSNGTNNDDLSAFNNDAFIHHSDQQQQQLLQLQQQPQQPQHSLASSISSESDLLSTLPKVAVPQGAKNSLLQAGLNQTQIDALAALVAHHQQQPANSSQLQQQQTSSPDPLQLQPTLQQQIIHQQEQLLLNPTVTPRSINPLKTDPVKTERSSVNTSSLQNREADAELDKRKRNTAASARFRIKKKLKEQQLERTVRELNELNATLEKKIQTLEMENKLLRNLVVEKGEQRNNHELELLKEKAKQ